MPSPVVLELVQHARRGSARIGDRERRHGVECASRGVAQHARHPDSSSMTTSRRPLEFRVRRRSTLWQGQGRAGHPTDRCSGEKGAPGRSEWRPRSGLGVLLQAPMRAAQRAEALGDRITRDDALAVRLVGQDRSVLEAVITELAVDFVGHDEQPIRGPSRGSTRPPSSCNTVPVGLPGLQNRDGRASVAAPLRPDARAGR